MSSRAQNVVFKVMIVTMVTVYTINGALMGIAMGMRILEGKY